MTRTVNGARLFGDREKEVLRKMLWQVSDFCGGEVLTYCLMSNHFHVLIRFPQAEAISDGELMRRYRALYPKATKYAPADPKVLERNLALGGERAAQIRERLLARMGDVSEFMKTLKQRFSIWYNHNHERFGPLWSERFKSVLVQGQGCPLQVMAAYIDLNPVRAGLVEDPKDYRWCGYAEAIGGSQRAALGLRKVWTYAGALVSPGQALQAHRQFLFSQGTLPGEGAGMDAEAARRGREDPDGVLPVGAALRCRIRYLTDGAILGTGEFIREFISLWQKNRKRKLPEAGYPVKGGDWEDLATIKTVRER